MQSHANAIAAQTPQISVLIPAKNEAGNIGQLAAEIHAALASTCNFEIILVDDGSTDSTAAEFLARCSELGASALCIRHQASCGQSTALWTAAQHARGVFLVTIDGDGQNDPADIPALYQCALAHGASAQHFCIAGFRKNRQDTRWKKIQSKIANGIRRRVLDDGVPDTGCGLKLIPAKTWRQLPYFDHMHRYLPALIKRLGGTIDIVAVNHRQRSAGVSKYTAWNRAWVGITDMMGVRWLIQRSKRPVIANTERTGEN